MRARIPPPSPCVTYRPVNGAIVAVKTETRDPVRFSDWEPEGATYRLRAMCLQETGETYCIGNARSHVHAQSLIYTHLTTHPEHHSAWVETL